MSIILKPYLSSPLYLNLLHHYWFKFKFVVPSYLVPNACNVLLVPLETLNKKSVIKEHTCTMKRFSVGVIVSSAHTHRQISITQGGGQKTHSSFWAKSSTRGVWSLFERRQVFVRNRCENIQKGRSQLDCHITGIKSLIHWNNLYHSSQSHTGSPSHPTGLLPSGLTCFHQDQLLKCLELTHIETWQPFKPTFRWVWCYIIKFPSLFM